jgi:hypothetical protein
MEQVRGRHSTAVELSRRTGMNYDASYRLLKDAEAHPYDVGRQLALQRALQRDDPGPRSAVDPSTRSEVQTARPVQPARPATRLRSAGTVRPPSGDDLLHRLHAGLAEAPGSLQRLRAEAVRDEVFRRHYDALRQRGVADAIVRVH